MSKEIRTFDPTDCELRAMRRGRTIEGVGIVFNKISADLGGFREIIKPEAVEGVLENSDILCLMNHDESRGILARSTNLQGSMDVSVSNGGVKCMFESPDTSLGDEALSGVRRGDIRAMSFAFTIAKDGDDWKEQQDGTYLRTITKFDKIYDLSLVYRPAYNDTSVAVRSLVDIKTSEAEKAKQEAEKRVADLEEELRQKAEAETPSTPTEVAEPAEDLTEYFKQLRNLIPKK